MKTKNVNKGFTLIEVLLVIALIGILLSIGLVNFNSEARLVDARNDIRKTHVQTLESTITQYKLQKGSYPAGLTRDYQEICDPDATSCTGFIDLKSSLVPDFIQAIPQDPNDTDNIGGSGYEIAIDEASSTVSIRLKEALREGGVDIKVNDPLPSVETSNANTPLAATVPNPPPIVTNGLVLHLDAGNPISYPGTGNTWFDLSGNNNHGTLVNGVGYNAANGGSLVFDGVNDRVNFSSFITGIENNHTIETAVYRTGDGINWPRFFINAQVNTSVVVTQFQNTTGILYRLRSGSTNYDYALPSGKLINNNWVLLSFSYDGVVMRAYINGIEYESGKPVNVITNTANTGIANIGGDSSVSAWNGRIGFNKVYNRALTPEEIQQNFNATRGRFGL